ncbi:MAG: ImmA/IrrE family metallo-endopeptidase [Ruminiclostridium sp.]
MTYDELIIQYGNLKIKEFDFSEIDPEEDLSGLCIDDNIFIRKNIPTTSEKTCILAEELGHYHTSCGNILDQTKVENTKQERQARNWAYGKLVPLDKLIEAYGSGVRNRHELALYLDIIEEFLEEAIKHYKEKYGLHYILDNYIIYFEPLGIYKIFE